MEAFSRVFVLSVYAEEQDERPATEKECFSETDAELGARLPLCDFWCNLAHRAGSIVLFAGRDKQARLCWKWSTAGLGLSPQELS